jgi:hypothetical protein
MIIAAVAAVLQDGHSCRQIDLSHLEGIAAENSVLAAPYFICMDFPGFADILFR